jgi:hypothetical protein
MTPENSALRILDGRYAVVDYVVAVQKDLPVALAYVNAFLDAAAQSGEIERAIRKAGLIGLNVALRSHARSQLAPGGNRTSGNALNAYLPSPQLCSPLAFP